MISETSDLPPFCLHNRSSIGFPPCGHFSNSSNDPCPEERININNINNMDEVVRYIGGPPPPSVSGSGVLVAPEPGSNKHPPPTIRLLILNIFFSFVVN